MPRTIESLVNAYQAAAERRQAGLPTWSRKIRIKHLLSGEDSDENAQKIGKQIAGILRASSWMTADLREAETLGKDSEVRICAEEFDEVDGLDDFNAVLDHLYDLADADRVWIG